VEFSNPDPDLAAPETTSALDTVRTPNSGQISDREKTFGTGEVLFSRTDKRGVIKAGNDVFERISGYPLEKLIGAPHKIIRHPEMPKAVFHMMWDTIKADRPFAGYVKNLDADGAHYWVLALATPVNDGYLSVRFKPGTEFFAKTKTLYDDIRDKERDEGLDPADSADLLVENLETQGFANYTAFAAQAAAAEIIARDKILGLPEDKQLSDMGLALEHIKNIATACQNLSDESRNVEALPMNLQVRSKRLGASAGPIGVIASDCSDRIKELRGQMIAFGEACEQTTAQACNFILLLCVARIQREIAEKMASQSAENGSSVDTAEVERLRHQSSYYAKATLPETEDMRTMKSQVERFIPAIRTLEKTIVGLNVNRIMCGIESVILGEHAGAITDIVNDLDQFQNRVPSYCRDIERNLRALQACMASAGNEVR